MTKDFCAGFEADPEGNRDGATPPSFLVEWEISLEGNKYIEFKLQFLMFM